MGIVNASNRKTRVDIISGGTQAADTFFGEFQPKFDAPSLEITGDLSGFVSANLVMRVRQGASTIERSLNDAIPLTPSPPEYFEIVSGVTGADTIDFKFDQSVDLDRFVVVEVR